MRDNPLTPTATATATSGAASGGGGGGAGGVGGGAGGVGGAIGGKAVGSGSSCVDPLELLRAELLEVQEEPGDRAETMRNLKVVAANIGAQRTRTELMPVLTEIVGTNHDIDDEALYALGDELVDLCLFLGGEEHYELLVPLIDTLCQQEEAVVREKAVDTVGVILDKKCSPEFRCKFATHHLVPLVEKQSKYEHFPARVSASCLLPIVYPHVPEPRKSELRQVFADLCSDDAPMVRRAAAAKLKTLATTYSKDDVVHSLMPVINQCWNDQLQDMVRASAVKGVAEFGTSSSISNSEFEEHVMPIVVGASRDHSWRVRLALVNSMEQLLKQSKNKNKAERQLTGILRNLIEDGEPELVARAVAVLEFCIPYINPAIMELTVFPSFDVLIQDAQVPVKVSLARAYGPLFKIVSKQFAAQSLVPQVQQLGTDRSRDVRLEMASQMAEICETLKTDIPQSLRELIVSLAEDSQWRIRLSVVKQLPRIVQIFGPESNNYTGNEVWESIFTAALFDSVCAVREAAVECSEALSKQFGQNWTENFLLQLLVDSCKVSFRRSSATVGDGAETNQQPPRVCVELEFRSPESYVSRTTLLHALEKIATLVSSQDVANKILPIILAATKDTIPNVRFVADRIIANMAEKNLFEAAIIREQIIPFLEDSLRNDTDIDVVYFAGDSLNRCNAVVQNAANARTKSGGNENAAAHNQQQ